MANVFEALSHPIRREVLDLFKHGGRTAGDLVAHFPVSAPIMSGNFAELKVAGLNLGARSCAPAGLAECCCS